MPNCQSAKKSRSKRSTKAGNLRKKGKMNHPCDGLEHGKYFGHDETLVSIAEGYVAEEALTFCSRYLKDDVETRFNRLGRNDDGLPEEEPNKFQVFRSACKLTGRMKATRLTTDVRQAVVWFVLNNSPEVDADILAYREKSGLDNWRRKRIFPPVVLITTREFLTTRLVAENVLWSTRRNPGAQLISATAVRISRSHGGDAGGSPPRRSQPAVPAQCESSNLRIETGNASLRRAFRQNGQRPMDDRL
ncbi:hypothetical protein Tco_0828513 [Tanacetum coccineum]